MCIFRKGAELHMRGATPFRGAGKVCNSPDFPQDSGMNNESLLVLNYLLNTIMFYCFHYHL